MEKRASLLPSHVFLKVSGILIPAGVICGAARHIPDRKEKKMPNLIAIVGRPNVGNSTIFHKLAGKRISIVEDTPGVTRDRIYSKAEWLGRSFMLVDTGGIEPDTKDVILS